MAIILDNRAISPAASPTQEPSSTPYALRNGAVTAMPDSELNTVRRGGPGSEGVTVDLDGFVTLDPQRLKPAPVDLVAQPSAAVVAPHSPDLDKHAGTIEAFNRLIKENNPTAAYGFLNNLLASGMEMGVYKPGHLEAVADIVNKALKQPGVSAAMAQEVLGHLKTQVYVNSDDTTLARIMDLAGAGVGSGNAQALQGDTLNQSPEAAREIMDRRVRGVLIDLTMTAEQKLAELNSIKEQYKLSGQGLRDSIDRALPNDQNKFVDSLSLEQVRKLQTDMNKVDDQFGSAFGLWENNGLQRALNRAEDGLLKQAAKEEKDRLSQKLNEDRLAKEAAARLEAQRIDQSPEAAREIMDRRVRGVLIDLTMTAEQKLAELNSIKEQYKLSGQGLRDSINRALPNDQNKFVDSLSLEQVRKLQTDMNKVDDQFGSAVGLWENNGLQRALNRAEDGLLKQAAKEEKDRLSQKLNEDRLAKEAAARLEAQRIDALKQNISATLLDKDLSSDAKIEAIRAQQRGGNFDDRRMAELIGQALAGKEKELVAGLSLEETQKLRADMKKLDAAFGGLKGNDGLQRALKNHAQSLIDEV
jgi:hypothetical protein